MRVVYAFLPTAALAFVGKVSLPRAAPQRAVDISSLDVSSLDPAVLGGVVAAVGAAAVLWCSKLAGLLALAANCWVKVLARSKMSLASICERCSRGRARKTAAKSFSRGPASVLQDASFGFCSH